MSFGGSCSWIYILVCWFYLTVQFVQVLPEKPTSSKEVTIGAIFETDGDELEALLEFAVNYVNRRRIMGPDMHLTYIVNKTSSIKDAFDIFHIGCDQAAAGVIGYIGPITSAMVSSLAPLSASMHIPTIAPFATSPLLARPGHFPYLVRLAPPDSLQALALVDLVAHFGWRKMVILTSDDDYGVHGLSSFAAEAAQRGWRVVSVQVFPISSRVSDMDVSPQLSAIRDFGVRVVILHCLSMFGLRVLEQAASLGMTSPGWAWIVTDGLTNTAADAPGADLLVGVVGTRPAADRGAQSNTLSALWRMHARTSDGLEALHSRIMDSVLTLAYALRDLEAVHNTTLSAPHLDCLSGHGWQQGRMLLDNLLQVDEDGVSARLRFNRDQSPAEVFYDYVNMQQHGWEKVGEWSEKDGASVTARILLPGGLTTVTDEPSHLKGRHLRVVVIDEPPFIILQRPLSPGPLRRQQVSGFCMELLDRLAELTGFTYSLYLVPDGIYGARDPDTGHWNGIVKELMERTADMSVAPLTITNVREQVIDFTKPYFDQGIDIVLQKPAPERWDPFKFTRPFTSELWYCILGTTLLVGVYLSLLNKLSPYDVHGQFIYRDEVLQRPIALRRRRLYRIYHRNKIEATTTLNLGNSLWLAVASVLHQGADEYPRALSSRLSVMLWWMGVVILIATYTANLAAHLTANRKVEPIATVEDLAAQTAILYGTVSHSSVHQFLSDSEVPLYSDMVTLMKQRHTLVINSSEGLERARRGGYAFLWDSAVLEYIIRLPPCDTLRTLRRPIGKSGFGFGLQKHSPYNTELSQHILSLRESGFVEQLRKRWYTEKVHCATSENQEKDKGHRIGTGQMIADLKSGYVFRKLGINDKIQGVFLIVWIGCGAGFLVLILEWVVACVSKVDKRHPKMPHSFAEAFWQRWRAVRLDLWESFFYRCCKKPPYSCENEQLSRNQTIKGSPWDSHSNVSNQRHNNNLSLSSEPPVRKLDIPRGGMVTRSLTQLDGLSSRHQAYLRMIRTAESRAGIHQGRSRGRTCQSHLKNHVASQNLSNGLNNWGFLPESGLRYSQYRRAPSPTTVSCGPYNV